MNARQFYKYKYMIALYDEEDLLVDVADNARQLLEHMGQPVTQYNLTNLRLKLKEIKTTGNNNRIKIYGKVCTVHFIKMIPGKARAKSCTMKTFKK